MIILKQCRAAILVVLFFSILTGLLYPLFITAIAQIFFPWRANGSLIIQNHKIIGSELIGQNFSDPKYFWGRPSATRPYPYNAEESAGSNLGPTNPLLFNHIKANILKFQQFDPGNKIPIPVDLVTASGSGLDPEIHPDAAFYQVGRIAKIRNIPAIKIIMLVQSKIKYRSLLILGEPRVNVLELNLALDELGSNFNG